jgi:spore maturation protein CgeB
MPPELVIGGLLTAIGAMASFIVAVFWYILKRQEKEITQWQETDKERSRISEAALTIAERNQTAIETLDGRVVRIEKKLEGLPASVANAVRRAMARNKAGDATP